MSEVSKGTKQCESRKGENSERNAEVRSSLDKGELLEEQEKHRHSAAEEELEIASERWRVGRRPSSVAKQEEGTHDWVDRHREGEEDSSEGGPGVSKWRFSPGAKLEEEEDGVSMRWFSPFESECKVVVVVLGMEVWEDEKEGGVGGQVVACNGASQLGGAFGSMEIVVPGRRSTGCSSRCFRNVTWKELKMLPSVVSQSL
jgi:hypothetical protein